MCLQKVTLGYNGSPKANFLLHNQWYNSYNFGIVEDTYKLFAPVVSKDWKWHVNSGMNQQ